MKTGFFATLVSGLAALVLAASASANSVQVTSDQDPTGGDCTLRDAIAAVTASGTSGACVPTIAPGPDTITFAPSLSGQTITLDPTFGELTINDPNDLQIVGPGMGQLTIDADAASRVFAITAIGKASISGLSVINGAPGSSLGVSQGGGIRNQGVLTLTDVRVANNTVIVPDSTGGNSLADGAGIHNASEATLTLDHSVVENNAAFATNTQGDATEAHARGAGVMSEGPLTIEDSTIRDNQATASDNGTGKAVASSGLASFADFDATHSTISGNTATAIQSGTGNAHAIGGIHADGGGTLELSTIAGNIADPTAAGGTTVPAGGIFNEAGTFDVRSSTIALNGPPSSPGVNGVNVYVQGGETNFSNTLISDPRGDGKNCINLSVVGSTGFNADYSPAGASCQLGSDTLTSNPLLAAGGLANNGGPTETVALQPSSPAIDAGSSDGADDATHDQRGLTRPVDFSGIPDAAGGDGSDIGAFEFQSTCTGQAIPDGTCPGPTPPGPGPGPAPAPGPTGTGLRAKALKKCKKIKAKSKAKAKKRKKCIKRAKKLPV